MRGFVRSGLRIFPTASGDQPRAFLGRRRHWASPLFLTVLAAVVAIWAISTGTAAPLVTTDKADYFSAETATITGTGFSPNTTYDIPIIRPNGSIVKGDGSLSLGWDTVTSNGSGAFTYYYTLDGIFGTYEIRVYPSPWSGDLSEGPITTTTFTDADIHWSQCSNDDNADDVAETCKWVEGGLNQNNSVFREGDVVPQRLFHKLTATGSYQFEFDYDFSKANTYAYDYMADALNLPQTTPAQAASARLNPCGDLPTFVTGTVCDATFFSGATVAPVASDPFDLVPGAEAQLASRDFRVACSGPGACSAIASFFPNGNSAGVPADVNENHVPDSDPDCTLTKTCGDSNVRIRLAVTTPAGTSNSSPTLVAIWFAGHLSVETYWGNTGCGNSHTSPCGSSSISGAPFHLKYSCLQEPNGTCDSVGNRDNQISPGAVNPVGDLHIIKDALPNDAQDFSFTCASPLGSFSLDDDADGTLSNIKDFFMVPAGSYTCTETVPGGWVSPPSISCTGDTDGGSTFSPPSVTIDLDNLEDITCTFTNLKQGTINIIKDAVPNDAQDFNFVCTGGLGIFSLDDDADGTLSNTQNFGSLSPGTYTCTETIPLIPWALTSISCSDPDGGTTTSVLTLTATIDLDPGETITCTFTNGQGNVTIIKDAVPNDAQDFSFSGSCFGSFSLDDDADGTLSNTKNGNLPPGSCTVTENAAPSGWAFTSLVCSDLDGGTTTAGQTATIDVDPGESIVCTYTNTKDGTISITKDAVPNDAQDFSFSGTCFAAFSLDDDADGTLSNNKTAGHTPASCTVTEDGPPATWSLTSLSCSDPDGGTTTAGATATIDLDPGETVSCTFTNTKGAQITITKDAVPNDAQDFSFSGTCFAAFSLDDDADGTLSNTRGPEVHAPGTCTVTEDAPPAIWNLTSLVCSDPDGGTTTGGATATIDLDPGETVSCTFTNTKDGTIVIIKDAIPDGEPQGFAFTCSPIPGVFTLDDNADLTFSNTRTFNGPPGTYTCSEAAPSGWTLTSLTCVDPSGGTSTGGATATIGLAAGETVTCTFINTQEAKIKITKDAVPDDAQDFSFSGSCFSAFSLDDDADGTLSNSKGPEVHAPGTCTVIEDGPPAGWTLITISCSDPDNGTTINVGTRTATIDLDPGETVECTFTNTGAGTITITKDTVPNDPQDFCFNGDLPDVNGVNQGDFCLDDDGNGALSTTHVANVAAGTYNVNELDPTPTADLTNIVCNDSDGGTSVNLVTRTATIDLDPNQSINCTFTNTMRGTVVIQKTALGGNDTFSYTGTGSGIPAAFAITTAGGSGSQTFSNIVPGAKSVTESAPPATWNLTGLSCSDPDGGTTTVGATANIDLDPGETVICIYTNTKDGTISITKDAVPNDAQDFSFSGTCFAAFSLDDDANGTLSNNTTSGHAPGTCTVTEDGPPATWSLSSLVCSDPDGGTTTAGATATIDLDPGETVGCTFTNTKDGVISITKDAVPNDAQDFSFSGSCFAAFSLDDDADGTLSNNETAGHAPGSCTVIEDGPPAGWFNTSLVCTDPDGGTTTNLGTRAATIDLDPGETVSCTFTNSREATIQIVKDAVPNDAQDFSFSGTCFAAFNLDDDTDGTLSNTKGPEVHAPGSCTVIEGAPPAPWVLMNIVCVDPDNGTTTNLGSRTATIDLDPGEAVTCTFTNEKQATITIIKDAQPDDPQNFAFSGTCFTPFSLDDDADGTLSNAKTATHAAGTCTVIEDGPPAGWNIFDIQCQDPSGGTTISVATRTANIDLAASETVSCMFTNIKLAKLTVCKDVVPNDSSLWDFQLVGPTPGSVDNLPDGGCHDFNNLIPGDYTLSETFQPGYQASVNCGAGTVNGTSIPVTLASGQQVTCTFVNAFHAGPPVVGGTMGLIGLSDAGAPDKSYGSDSTGQSFGAILATALAGASVLGAAVWYAARRRQSQ